MGLVTEGGGWDGFWADEVGYGGVELGRAGFGSVRFVGLGWSGLDWLGGWG